MQGTRDCPVKLRSDLNRSEHPQPQWMFFSEDVLGCLASKRPKRNSDVSIIGGDSCFLVFGMGVSLKRTLEILRTKAHSFAMNDCMALPQPVDLGKDHQVLMARANHLGD